MSQSNYLAGKVVHQSLPQIPAPPPPGAPHLKRLMLAQGELAQFYDAEEGMRYLALIELRAGTIRGNHFHKVKVELIYVIQGAVDLVVEDIESKQRETIFMRTGDLALIQTGIAHALRVSTPGNAIECSVSRFDAADIYRYPLA
jgi:hypothetical protein